MSLVGNLEDLGLGEILQIVSLSRKSGILSLQTDGREGKVYFRDGQVIRANTSSRRENLGELLLRKELVDFDTLKEAVQIQQREGGEMRLGDILAERFDISRDAIEAAVKEQVEKIVYGFFTWAEGTFSFALGDAEELGETSFNPLQFMLDQGLNPQWLAMEGSRLLDEKIHRGEPLEDEPEEGPTFDIDELLSDDVEFSAHPEQSGVAEEAPPASAGIYLIDDDPETLTAVSSGLESAGQQVEAFEDAEEYLYGVAAAVDAGQKPRLLIDLFMPRKDGRGEMGGLELLEQIYSRFPDLPAAVMSEEKNPEAEQALQRLGDVSLVEKPPKENLAGDLGSVVDELVVSAGKALGFIEAVEPALESPAPGEPGGAAAAFNLGAELRREFGEQDIDPDKAVASPGLHLLRDMLVELQNPSLGGGIILLVLRFASELMNRAVIFAVKDTEIIGLGQFGIQVDGENPDARIRRMRLSTENDSVFKTLVESKTPIKVALGAGPVDTHIAEQLGGGRPKEVFLGPILSEGKVVAILYGDNLPEQTEIGDTESLEIFLSQAGLAMEKAILERRLRVNRD